MRKANDIFKELGFNSKGAPGAAKALVKNLVATARQAPLNEEQQQQILSLEAVILPLSRQLKQMPSLLVDLAPRPPVQLSFHFADPAEDADRADGDES